MSEEIEKSVTDEICELRMKNVLSEVITKTSEQIRLLRENDIPHLVDHFDKVCNELKQAISNIANRMTSIETWKNSHEESHGKQLKLWQMALTIGGWVISFITLILLLITMYHKG